MSYITPNQRLRARPRAKSISSSTIVPSTLGSTIVVGSKTSDSVPIPDSSFTTATDILSRAYSTAGDALIVAPTSAEEYHALLETRDRSGSKARLFYLADQRLLIVTIPTAHHEVLHLRLNRLVTVEMTYMGLEDDWQDTGATTFRSALGDKSAGEGDSGGRPNTTRPGADAWPVLVVEAG